MNVQPVSIGDTVTPQLVEALHAGRDAHMALEELAVAFGGVAESVNPLNAALKELIAHGHMQFWHHLAQGRSIWKRVYRSGGRNRKKRVKWVKRT